MPLLEFSPTKKFTDKKKVLFILKWILVRRQMVFKKRSQTTYILLDDQIEGLDDQIDFFF